ncbi:MAG: Na/Pi cotransporter family protein [Bacteroidales bacterium]|nr:Na/Pi cotransporter family protein [Bacteroidales bacterium]
MDFIEILKAVLTLLSGIGIFLIACQMMSSNLEAASSERLKKLFSKTSSNPLLGVGIGAASTALIQSSGATTVMTIGFVNAGIISLYQAATLIYGANIGTTVTAQIVALGMFGGGGISTTMIFSALAGVGAFLMMFSKKSTWKTTGGIITGFGMLFVGLSLMSGSMEAFAAQDGVKSLLASIGNPLLLVLIGAVLTAIIQSSSVMTSIALAMVVTGLISLDQGILLTMGSNIGSCVVAILAGMTSSLNARRTALIHLLFNCFGVALFLIAGLILNLVTNGISYGSVFAKLFPGAPQTQLAMFHTFFNTVTVAVVLPLTTPLVNAVCKMLPEGKEKNAEPAMRLKYLDENLLRTPAVAVGQVRREILRMADLAMENVDRSLQIITQMDFSEKENFDKTEQELNFMNQAIVDYVVRLSEKNGLSDRDHVYLATTYRSARDLERVGDYAENIVEYAQNLKNIDEQFSDDALYEISQLKALLHELFDQVCIAYRDNDAEALAKANEIEEQTDEYTDMMEENHIKRLGSGICTATVGAQYLSLSSNTERIADHLINVAKTIR